MEWTPILAFAVIAIAYGVGDIVSAKTQGVVSSIITAILIFLIFGGGLKILPADLMNQSGLMTLIPTFGLALILVNVGSMLNLNELKKEWKTVLVSIGGIGGIVLIAYTVGSAIFGREQAICGIAPTAGGMAAAMVLTESANQAGRPDLAAFVAAVIVLQIFVGLPISSFCLRKEAQNFINSGRHKLEGTTEDRKNINLRLIPETSKALDIPTLHLARLAVVGVIAQLCTQLTGISTGVTYLLFGVIFGAIGFIDKGSLRKSGSEGLLMLAAYACVGSSFVGMTFAQFGKMLVPVVGLLLMSAVGIMILSIIVGKLVKWSPWLSIGVGLSCMFGYPSTYAVAMEVSAGAVKDKGFTAIEEQRVVDHILPKMMISGMVSVSLVSVILAGLIAPMIFS